MAFRKLGKKPTVAAPVRSLPVFKLPAAKPAAKPAPKPAAMLVKRSPLVASAAFKSAPMAVKAPPLMAQTIAQARPLLQTKAVLKAPTPVRRLVTNAAQGLSGSTESGIVGTRRLGKRPTPEASPSGIVGTRRLGKRPDVATPQQEPAQSSAPSGGGSGGGGGGGGSSEADEREAAPQEDWSEAAPQEAAPQEDWSESAVQSTATDGPEQSIDGQSFVGADEVAFPLVSSHLDGDKLKTVALALTSDGCTLVNCRSRAKPIKQGPVTFGAEKHPDLRRAIAGQKHLLLANASIEKQREKAGELVERARQGDQNAMAIIALVRENRKKGNPRASCSFEFIQEYIQSHPIASFGAENERRKARDEYTWACPLLANGPTLTNRRIVQTASVFGNEEDRRAFLFGVSRADRAQAAPGVLDETQVKLFKIGKVIGQARKLQAVRRPDSKISAFDPMIGWELGE